MQMCRRRRVDLADWSSMFGVDFGAALLGGKWFLFFFFFLNDPAPTEFYPLPLPASLPISRRDVAGAQRLSANIDAEPFQHRGERLPGERRIVDRVARPVETDNKAVADKLVLAHSLDTDRKSTRLNSSHSQISYAVFCLKKK